MRQLFFFCFLSIQLASCKLMPKADSAADGNKVFSQYLSDYYEGRTRLSPLDATQNGDDRYNALLPADFTDSYRDSLKSFYTKCQTSLHGFDRNTLNENDRLSYDILSWELDTRLAGFRFQDNYIP